MPGPIGPPGPTGPPGPMPYRYASENLQDAAQRGRRVIMRHPHWRMYVRRNPIPWQMLATEQMADILHGLNSRRGLTEDDLQGILNSVRETYLMDLRENEGDDPNSP